VDRSAAGFLAVRRFPCIPGIGRSADRDLALGAEDRIAQVHLDDASVSSPAAGLAAARRDRALRRRPRRSSNIDPRSEVSNPGFSAGESLEPLEPGLPPPKSRAWRWNSRAFCSSKPGRVEISPNSS